MMLARNAEYMERYQRLLTIMKTAMTMMQREQEEQTSRHDHHPMESGNGEGNRNNDNDHNDDDDRLDDHSMIGGSYGELDDEQEEQEQEEEEVGEMTHDDDHDDDDDHDEYAMINHRYPRLVMIMKEAIMMLDQEDGPQKDIPDVMMMKKPQGRDEHDHDHHNDHPIVHVGDIDEEMSWLLAEDNNHLLHEVYKEYMNLDHDHDDDDDEVDDDDNHDMDHHGIPAATDRSVTKRDPPAAVTMVGTIAAVSRTYVDPRRMLFFIVMIMMLLGYVTYTALDTVDHMARTWMPQYQSNLHDMTSALSLLHMEQEEYQATMDHYAQLQQQFNFTANMLSFYYDKKRHDYHRYISYQNDSMMTYRFIIREQHQLSSMQKHLHDTEHDMNVTWDDIVIDLQNLTMNATATTTTTTTTNKNTTTKTKKAKINAATIIPQEEAPVSVELPPQPEQPPQPLMPPTPSPTLAEQERQQQEEQQPTTPSVCNRIVTTVTMRIVSSRRFCEWIEGKKSSASTDGEPPPPPPPQQQPTTQRRRRILMKANHHDNRTSAATTLLLHNETYLELLLHDIGPYHPILQNSTEKNHHIKNDTITVTITETLLNNETYTKLIKDLQQYQALQKDEQHYDQVQHHLENKIKEYQQEYLIVRNDSKAYDQFYQSDLQQIQYYQGQYHAIHDNINQTKIYLVRIQQSMIINHGKVTNHQQNAISLQLVIQQQCHYGMISSIIMSICYVVAMIWYIHSILVNVIKPLWMFHYHRIVTDDSMMMTMPPYHHRDHQTWMNHRPPIMVFVTYYWKHYQSSISMMVQHSIIVIMLIQFQKISWESIYENYYHPTVPVSYTFLSFSVMGATIQMMLYRLIPRLLCAWYTSSSSSSSNGVTAIVRSTRSRIMEHDSDDDHHVIPQRTRMLSGTWIQVTLLCHWILLCGTFLLELFVAVLTGMVDFIIVHLDSYMIPLLFVCLYIRYLLQQCDNYNEWTTKASTRQQHYATCDDDDHYHTCRNDDDNELHKRESALNNNVTNHVCDDNIPPQLCYSSCSNADVDNRDYDMIDNRDYNMIREQGDTEINPGRRLNTPITVATTIAPTPSSSSTSTIATPPPKTPKRTKRNTPSRRPTTRAGNHHVECASSVGSTSSWPSRQSIWLEPQTPYTPASDTTPLLLSSIRSSRSDSSNRSHHSHNNSNHDADPNIEDPNHRQIELFPSCWDVKSLQTGWDVKSLQQGFCNKSVLPHYYRTPTKEMEMNNTTLISMEEAKQSSSASSILSRWYHYIKLLINHVLFLYHYEETTTYVMQWNIILCFIMFLLLSIHCMMYLSHVHEMIMKTN